MASRVGGTYGPGAATVTRTFTGGVNNGAVLHGKFEGGTGVSAPTSFTDAGGNAWTREALVYHATADEPGLVIYCCYGLVSSGSVAVTIPYTGSGTFLQTEVEEWSPASGLTFALDSITTAQQSGGAGGTGTYNAVGTVSATAAGFAIYAVSAYASLATLTGGGTPAFAPTVAATPNGDSFTAYAAITGAGSVTPSISTSSGFTRSVQALVLIKEVAAGSSAVPAAYHLMQMQG